MPSEFDLIARHFAPIAGPGGLGLLDDAALIQPPAGHDLVVTTDAIVAGVHFFADDPPDTVARKALGVNLSDLAAKGADPLGFVLTLVMARHTDEAWLAAFAQGLGAMARDFACPLIGGDTVASAGPTTLSVTAFGAVRTGRMVRRGGTRAGDILFATGFIGDAALGLQARLAARRGEPWALSPDHRAYLDDRYLVPRPRNAVAAALGAHANAAMDVSDGFVGDLAKMLALAGIGADVRLADVPLSVAARAAIRRDGELLDAALTGGDDYEVVASVPAAAAPAFQAQCLAAGVPATQVGAARDAGAPIRFLDAEGVEKVFPRGSYVHGGG